MDGSRLDITVLYVDDEQVTRHRLVSLLEREAARVLEAGDGQEGLQQYRTYRPDVVITDIRMPVMDGIAMAREIKRADPDAEIIVTSAHNEAALLLDAIDIGVAGYLLKPVDTRLLLSAVAKVSERKRLKEALERSERHFRNLVEQSPDALLLVNRRTECIEECNEQACILLKYDRRTLLGLSLARIEVVDDSGRSPSICSLDAASLPLTMETTLRRKDGSMAPVEFRAGLLDSGRPPRMIVHIRDISARKLAEQEREALISDLRKAGAEIKTLQGIIPICACCKKVRDDQGFWKQVEAYLGEKAAVEFSHGICPDCVRKYYSDFSK